MGQRLDFQALLEDLLGTDKVYFQPPSNIEMAYPCIVYQRDSAATKFADGVPYHYDQRYLVTLIERDPDSSFLAPLAALPTSIFDRHYVADNLHHDVYKIYF